MYTKEAAAALHSEFWTVFGKYMAPVLSHDGEKINWVNYKTGIKNIQFKMEATKETATIGIYISHKELSQRLVYYEQLLASKKILQSILGEQWNWRDLDYLASDNPYSSASTTIYDVNIYDKNTWPAIISFFKQRMILLDEWWSNAKYIFENL